MPPKIESNALSLTRRSRKPAPSPAIDPSLGQGSGPEAKHVRIPRRDSPLRGQEGASRMRHDVQARTSMAPPPRTSLCARVTRCLAVLTGLGAIGLQFHFSRLPRGTSPLPRAPSVPPLPSTTWQPDGSRPSEGPQTAAQGTVYAVHEVARIVQESQADLFEMFRDSPDCRDPSKLAAFMRIMARAISHSPAETDAYLPTLLRVWRWTYGETYRTPDGHEFHVGNLIERSIVAPVVNELGGPNISQAQLQQLVLTVCREPENIPPTLEDPAALGLHAYFSARALIELIRLSTPRRTPGATISERQEAEVTQLRRCLDMALRLPSAHPRWMPLVFESLRAQGPKWSLGMVSLPDRWFEVIEQALLQHAQAATQRAKTQGIYRG